MLAIRTALAEPMGPSMGIAFSKTQLQGLYAVMARLRKTAKEAVGVFVDYLARFGMESAVSAFRLAARMMWRRKHRPVFTVLEEQNSRRLKGNAFRLKADTGEWSATGLRIWMTIAKPAPAETTTTARMARVWLTVMKPPGPVPRTGIKQ